MTSVVVNMTITPQQPQKERDHTIHTHIHTHIPNTHTHIPVLNMSNNTTRKRRRMLYIVGILSAVCFATLIRILYHFGSRDCLLNVFQRFLVLALAVCHIWCLLLPKCIWKYVFRWMIVWCTFLPSIAYCVNNLINTGNKNTGFKVAEMSSLAMSMLTLFCFTPYVFFKNNQGHIHGKVRSGLTVSLTILFISGAYLAVGLQNVWDIEALAPIILALFVFLIVLLNDRGTYWVWIGICYDFPFFRW